MARLGQYSGMFPGNVGVTLRAMRRLLTLPILTALLCACTGTASPRVAASPSELGRKQVEAAFRLTHFVMLPNIAAVLPKGEVMDYGFIEKGTERHVSATVVLYPTSTRARRGAVVYEHGVLTKRYIIPASRTLRVRNVVLILDPDIVKQDEKVLTAALSRLGAPVAP